MIPFNKSPVLGTELRYLEEVIKNQRFCGDGPFGKKCEQWFQKQLNLKKTLMTPSCTHALEMAAILMDIKPGDEVIMPSYTFVSTANAFALRGARIVFVDIRPDTMNINEELIEPAITEQTRAIVPVHYAGVACEMDKIMQVANKYNLYVVEDAAQGVLSFYKGRPLGSIGHFGAFSFHETKNYSSGGEGGLLIINDEKFVQKAEIVREKGTNRSQFFRGMVDKYSWVSIGSSYLPSELQSAYLYAQLEDSEKIKSTRVNLWKQYSRGFELLRTNEVELPFVPTECEHNGHMFYLKTRDFEERNKLISYLEKKGIMSVFHYVPLHNSPMGRDVGRFVGKDMHTTKESDRLLRLPMWYGLTKENVDYIISCVCSFYKSRY